MHGSCIGSAVTVFNLVTVDANLWQACTKSISNTQNEVERYPGPDIHSRLVSFVLKCPANFWPVRVMRSMHKSIKNGSRTTFWTDRRSRPSHRYSRTTYEFLSTMFFVNMASKLRNWRFADGPLTNFSDCYKLFDWRFCACTINVTSSMCSEMTKHVLYKCHGLSVNSPVVITVKSCLKCRSIQ